MGQSGLRGEGMTHQQKQLQQFLDNPYLLDAEWGCWIWTGAMNTMGYPTSSRQQKPFYVHRAAYEAVYGPIPEGFELDHLCRAPMCYHPLHLEAVTHLENVRRGLGNQYRGKTHCLRGHEFTPANTMLLPRGRRSCRRCINLRVAGLIRPRPYRRAVSA